MGSSSIDSSHQFSSPESYPAGLLSSTPSLSPASQDASSHDISTTNDSYSHSIAAPIVISEYDEDERHQPQVGLVVHQRVKSDP
jgi:hypothetical protein